MGEHRVGERRRGGEGVIVGAGGSGDDSASESMAASFDSGASSGSLCSSIMSSLTDDDDDAESSPVAGDPTSSSSSSPSDAMQLEGDGGGPLYELSPLLAHLPVRTGLSKYYKGKSQSFTSLSDPRLQEGEPLIDFASCSRTFQQDDSEEVGAHGFFGPGAVKSMEQGPFSQKR